MKENEMKTINQVFILGIALCVFFATFCTYIYLWEALPIFVVLAYVSYNKFKSLPIYKYIFYSIFCASAIIIIDYTIKIGFSEQKTIATVDFEDGLFYLCIADKTDLLLCNKFVFKSPEDILYFLLYSLEQFEIKPANCQLHICGMVSQNSNALVLLREYFDQVVIEENEIQNAIELKYQTAFFHQDACV